MNTVIDSIKNFFISLSEGVAGTAVLVWVKYNLADELVHWSIVALSTISMTILAHYVRRLLKKIDEKRELKRASKLAKERKEKLDKLGVIV